MDPGFLMLRDHEANHEAKSFFGSLIYAENCRRKNSRCKLRLRGTDTGTRNERERNRSVFFLIMQRPWPCLLLQSSPWVGPGEWGGVAVASRTLAPGTNHQRPLKKNNACKRAASWTSCSAATLDVSASTCFFWIYYDNFVRRIVVNWWVARGCVASGSTRGHLANCPLQTLSSLDWSHCWVAEDAAKSWFSDIFQRCYLMQTWSSDNFFFCVHS
jgi:hypothetical protein